MKTGGIINSGNGAYPAPILKHRKTVRWGDAITWHYETNKWEARPLLNEVAIAKKTAAIKQAPVIQRPLQPLTVIPPKPKIEWTLWQRIARGHWIAYAAPLVFCASIVALAMTGPAGLVLPLGFALLCAGCWAYRRHTAPPEMIAKEKMAAEILRKKFLAKAEVMKSTENYDQAYVYERLAKKLK